jgi:hypothetical protein
MAENWIQEMNRLTGPAPCQCSIVGPHQPDNPHCPRNRSTVHKSEPFTPLNGAGEPAATHFVNEHGEAEQLYDCEGITLESSKPFAFQCCDCGLTHHMVIVSEDGKPVGFAVKRVTPAGVSASDLGACAEPNHKEQK